MKKVPECTGSNFTQPDATEGTLRDQFAMHALAELISLGWGDWVASGDSGEFADRYPEMAIEAYRIADAMLAARTGTLRFSATASRNI